MCQKLSGFLLGIHILAHPTQLAISAPHFAGYYNQKVLLLSRAVWSTGLVKFCFTAMLGLIVHNINDKVMILKTLRSRGQG